jgi:two-component system OmpR family sensor kinase
MPRAPRPLAFRGSLPLLARLRPRAGAARRALRRTPLWTRLVAGTLLLVTLALLITGLVGTRLLAGYLVDRIDDQLIAAARMTHGAGVRSLPIEGITRREWLLRLQQPQPGQPGRQGRQRPPGHPVESGPRQRMLGPFYAAVLDDTGQIMQFVTPSIGDGGEPELPSLTRSEAATRAGKPFTAESAAPGGSPWRVIVQPMGAGSFVFALSLRDAESTVARLTFIYFAVGVCVLGALGVAGYGLVRASLRPLTEIEATAEAIAAGDLSRRVPRRDPRTELGRLARSLNGMLSQIERAFRAREESAAAAIRAEETARKSEEAARRSEERMRRFVADASHELRTPLTSIRGFAELYRQEGGNDPAEAARLLRRIEDAGARMGLLVDDLLLLARLDQQRPLEAAPVDLLALAADAVLDARALAADRTIELDRNDGKDGPIMVCGDEVRLRQVLGNLMTNALTHTPAGTPVRVGLGSATHDGRRHTVLEVVDEGPGMAEADAQRVFERFYRVDPSRHRPGGDRRHGNGQDGGRARATGGRPDGGDRPGFGGRDGKAQGGAGLGLSIVAAIARAHGGAIELDTAPGAGATFRLLLPAPDSDIEP